jgi:hypothetical protein
VLVALLALAALAVIVVAAVAVKQGGSVLPGAVVDNSNSSTPVQLTATGAYDPEGGGGGEHDSAAPNATDGNQSTYWTTEHYSSPNFGGLGKTGVGLVLTTSGGTPKTLTVTSDTPGFTAVVKSGSSPESAQTVSDSEVVGDKTTFDLNGATGPVVVLWITRLSPEDRARVNEVTAAR